jgi:hypothetical protein
MDEREQRIRAQAVEVYDTLNSVAFGGDPLAYIIGTCLDLSEAWEIYEAYLELEGD